MTDQTLTFTGVIERVRDDAPSSPVAPRWAVGCIGVGVVLVAVSVGLLAGLDTVRSVVALVW
jgi:hypothetical protein